MNISYGQRCQTCVNYISISQTSRVWSSCIGQSSSRASESLGCALTRISVEDLFGHMQWSGGSWLSIILRLLSFYLLLELEVHRSGNAEGVMDIKWGSSNIKLEPIRLDWNLSFLIATDLGGAHALQRPRLFVTGWKMHTWSRSQQHF